METLIESWIKLFREFLNWEWFHKSEMVHLFIWLLLKANVTEQRWQGHVVKRGQVLTTYKEMEQGTHISQQKLRT